jgi:hypothetical protein
MAWNPGDDPIELEVRGVRYVITVLDEPELETDPTLLIFREDEEEAIVTAHLDSAAPCTAHGVDGHVVVREPAEDA